MEFPVNVEHLKPGRYVRFNKKITCELNDVSYYKGINILEDCVFEISFVNNNYFRIINSPKKTIGSSYWWYHINQISAIYDNNPDEATQPITEIESDWKALMGIESD